MHDLLKHTNQISLFTAITVSILCNPIANAEKPAPQKSMTMVLVGDVGLNRSTRKVDPKGVLEGNSILPWSELMAKIAPLIDGDLNFMNLETVVTDRNDLKPGDKRQKTPYLFRSHPVGIAALLDLGFNMISAANNHAFDYGDAGTRETVSHLQRLLSSRPGSVVAGIGLSRTEAAKPAHLKKLGVDIAFSSIGIVTNSLHFHGAGPHKPGTLRYRFPADWKYSVQTLVKNKAPLKVLSIHYGTERSIRTDDKQRKEWRQAIDEGVDVIIGHHAHVVRGIELRNGKPIFYGLGNFLIRGAANMGKKPSMRIFGDYGLLAKLHFEKQDNDMKLLAIQVVPIFDMHRIAKPLEATEAAKRIQVLNVLAEPLDNIKQGSQGVRFATQKDGSGLFCLPEAKTGPSDIAKLCKNYVGPTAVSSEIRKRVKRKL